MTGKNLSFSFPIYARALATVIKESSKDRAFVVGLTGPWGSGKTTLMEAVLSELGEKDFLPVRFNAWAHSKQDSVWRALFIAIVAELKKHLEQRFPKGEDGFRSADGAKLETALNDAEKALYTAFTRETPGEMQLDVGQLAKSGAKLALRFLPWGDIGVNIANWFYQSRTQEKKSKETDAAELKEEDVEQLLGIFKRDVVRQHVAQIQSMEQFRTSIESILTIGLNNGLRLIVAVDDVDRCLPEQGLEVFEAIKLYLDLLGSVFIVAMDQEVLQHALDIRYEQKVEAARRITAELYAEKMIDVTFTIPPYDKEGFQKFIDNLPLSEVLESHIDLVSPVLPHNPRTWERFANRVALHKKILDDIAKDRGLQDLWRTTDLENVFIKMQLLNFRWPSVTRTVGSFDNLLVLEECVKQVHVGSDKFQQRAKAESPQKALREFSTISAKLPENLWPYLGDMTLLKLLASPPTFSQQQGVKLLISKIFSLDLPHSNATTNEVATLSE